MIRIRRAFTIMLILFALLPVAAQRKQIGEAKTILLRGKDYAKAEKMMTEWNKLDQYLLVKYMDGNVKKEENGKFKVTEYGGSAMPDMPLYPEWFYRQIIKDHGKIIEEK